MSIDHRARGIHVSSGEGIVAHLPNLTAYANGDESQLNELLVRLNALAGAPWHEVVRTLTAGIAESNFEAHPDVACVSIGQDRVAALVFGDTTLTVTTDGNEHTLDGRDSSTWIDVAIHGIVDNVRAGSQSESMIVGVLRDGVVPAGGFLLDTSGPMPASGRWAEVTTSSTATAEVADVPPPVPSNESGFAESGFAPLDDTPATSAADAADPEQEVEAELVVPHVPPDSANDDDSDAASLGDMFARIDELHREEGSDLIDDIAQETVAQPTNGEAAINEESLTEQARDAEPVDTDATVADLPPAIPTTGTLAPPRPQLRGILCPDGHLTSSSDVQCRTCSQAVDADAELVMGDRPVLGQLAFDDGAVLSVDRPAAIGSDVPAGYEIDGEPATVVRLDDGLGGVSPIQVEVRPVGWDVEIHDMNSENGTYTILDGERQTRTRLRAGQSVVLQEGMLIEVGGRNFTYSVGSQA